MEGNLINFFLVAYLRHFHTEVLQEIFASQRGIKLNGGNIQSTFESADINLKASIKRIEDI